MGRATASSSYLILQQTALLRGDAAPLVLLGIL